MQRRKTEEIYMVGSAHLAHHSEHVLKRSRHASSCGDITSAFRALIALFRRLRSFSYFFHHLVRLIGFKMFGVNRLKSDGDQKISRNLNMIKLFYQNKDYATAKNYVTDLLVLKPDSSEAYKLLSQINEALGEHELAMKNYKKSLDLKVSTDYNSSFENTHQFTPTKVSSPVVSKNHSHQVSNQVHVQGNHVNNHVSHESLEKLIETKFSAIEKSFESINQNLAKLNESVNKNYEEVSDIKKKFTDMQKKITLLASKQEELNNKFSVIPPSQPTKDDWLKDQLKAITAKFTDFSGDHGRIITELDRVKEVVEALVERHNNLSDFDEESYNDEEEEIQPSRPLNLANQPNLNQLFKPDKDSWRCSVCDTPNSPTEPACVCCENPNPNAPKPAINGFSSTGAASPFKFGAPSAAAASVAPNPAYSFGAQIAPAANSAFPKFGISSPVNSSLTTPKPVATTANVIPTFGSFANANSPLNSKPVLSSNGPTTAASTNTSAFPSFASAFNSNATTVFQVTSKPAATSVSSTALQSFGNNSSLSALLSSSSTMSTSAGTANSFSFTNTLNSLSNNTKTLPPKASTTSGLLSFSNTFAPATTASSAATTNPSSFSFSLKPTNSGPTSTTMSNGLAFPSPNGSNFSFSTSENSNSIFANNPKSTSSNFSFGNLSFSNNLFSQQPNTNSDKNEPKKEDKFEAKNNDNEDGYEEGADNAPDGDYFKLPDVKLPEKYDQVTGEEDEEVAFEKKSKLFIFKDDEYKERGVGIIKILKNPKSLKYRVLMRRDHIFKVCLNAYLDEITNLEIVDQKFLRFSCLDFSEDKPASGVFLLKFGQATTLSEFKDLVESLKSASKSTSPQVSKSQPNLDSKQVDNTEVELVYTKEPKPEHLEMISKLRLPVNFYDYEDKKPCKGCIGCNDGRIQWDDLTQSESDKTDSSNAGNPDMGLFSSIATDMNLVQNKVDTIAADNEVVDNDHMVDQNFVSEKSKLLPQNFEVKTGEEDEEIMFNERAKMFHFVSEEWKERGVGNMKILKRKDKDVFRLLMRRDKILNVICNHKISKHIKLGPFQNSNNTLTWYARDYSEEAGGLDELFALKFRNETLMKQFENTVKECVEKSS